MLPHMGPEFIEALLSRTADEITINTSVEASQDPEACKGQDRIAPLGRVTFSTPSRIVAIIMIACVICLIIYFVVVSI